MLQGCSALDLAVLHSWLLNEDEAMRAPEASGKSISAFEVALLPI